MKTLFASLAWILMMLAATLCHGANEILTYTPQNPSTRSKAKINPGPTSGTLVVSDIITTSLTLQGQPPHRILQTTTDSAVVAVTTGTLGQFLTITQQTPYLTYGWADGGGSGPTTDSLATVFYRLDTSNNPLTGPVIIDRGSADDPGLTIVRSGGVNPHTLGFSTASDGSKIEADAQINLNSTNSALDFHAWTDQMFSAGESGSASHFFSFLIDTAEYLRLDEGFSLVTLGGSGINVNVPILTTNTLVQADSNKNLTSVPNGTTSQTLVLNSSLQKVWRSPGGDSGIGTVTSVGLLMPASIYTSVSNSPITSSGILIPILKTQTTNTVWSGPMSGADTVPTFRALVAADLPSGGYDTSYLRLDTSNSPLTGPLGISSLTANTMLQSNGSKQIVSLANGSTSQVLTMISSSTQGWRTPGTGGIGTVTSVGLSLPSIITVSGSPVTSAGTLTGTLATQTANTVFSGPTTGSSAAPTFRSLVAADMPGSVLINPMTTAGDVIYGLTSGVPQRLGAGSSTQVFHSGTVPSWSAVSLTADVSGVLPMANGGSNKALTASNGGIVWTDADSMEVLAGTATARQLLWSGATATPAWSPYTLPATVAQGDTFYALTSSGVSALAKDTNATRYMSNQGTSNAPSWNQVNLANGVTGTLPNANLTNSSISFTDGAGIGGSGSPTSLGGTYIVSATSANPQFNSMGLGSAAVSGIPLSATAATTSTILINVTGGAAGNTSRLGFRFNTGRLGARIDSVVGGGFVGDLRFYTNPTGALNAETEKVRILGDGRTGFGTTGPDGQVDSLSTSLPQLVATYTDGSVSTFLTTDSGGDFTIAPTGLDMNLTSDVHTKAGTSSGHIVNVGGMYSFNTTTVGNVGIGTDDLQVSSIPANSLTANGDTIQFTMEFKVASTATVKVGAIVIGTTSFTAFAPVLSVAGDVSLVGTVTRTSSTDGLVAFTVCADAGVLSGTSSNVINSTVSTSGWSSAQALKATAVGVTDNDITQQLTLVEWMSSGAQ